METKPLEQNAVATHVDQLLSQMTLEEKIGQMTQVDISVISLTGGQNSPDPIDPVKLETAIEKYHVGSILNTPTTPDNQAQPIETWRRMMRKIEQASAKTRLKIPVIYGIDAIHGANYTQNAVLFPQAISMAATFNPELSFKEGEITAREVRASGLHWSFSPVMDIGRQPLWPRLWETYGEDVYLATVMGSEYIRGHQGESFADATKAPTCLKHYLGYSYPLNGKDRTPAWIGERMLREYFLPTFEAGVKAGSPTIMINSAEVDGIPGHANYQYLTTILRGELGFKGFTVSDWEDIKRLFTRDKVAASPKDAVKIAVMAGVDMSMVPFDFSFYDYLLELVKAGEVPLSRIDEAVRRILTVKYNAGLFDRERSQLPVENNFATAEAKAISLQAARESIILAKNDNHILPLKRETNILVTGPTADLLSVLNGGWTITWQGTAEHLYPKDKATVFQALKKRSTGKVSNLSDDQDDPSALNKILAETKNYDVILLCLGELPYTETPGNIESLELDASQQKLAKALLNTGKPVILLTLGGRPRIITDIANQSQAVLLGFLPGMAGGEAIADILYGDYNPDGKLPVTYPRHTNGITLYDYKPMENFELNVYNPLYSFGHGLSYTTFSTGGLALEKSRIKKNENLAISVNVTNTGSIKGKETVLLYLHDAIASVTRPNKQLKAFQKVELAPGETKTVKFMLTPHDLSFISADMKRIIEAGEFSVLVGQETASFWVDG